MLNINRRIEKLEKELGIEDKTQWLRFPDPDSPGGFIEIKGCRSLVDVAAMAAVKQTKDFTKLESNEKQPKATNIRKV